jgi:hypothetical protein
VTTAAANSLASTFLLLAFLVPLVQGGSLGFQGALFWATIHFTPEWTGRIHRLDTHSPWLTLTFRSEAPLALGQWLWNMDGVVVDDIYDSGGAFVSSR